MMSDKDKLRKLAEACSDAVLGGERGWEEMDFEDFVTEVRIRLVERDKLLNVFSSLDPDRFPGPFICSEVKDPKTKKVVGYEICETMGSNNTAYFTKVM